MPSPRVAIKTEDPPSEESDVKEESESEEESESKEELEADVSFDESGEVYLVVGREPGQKMFQVCARAIARASPVLKALIDQYSGNSGPSAEQGTPDNNRLLDDPPEDMKRFLAIVHAKFQYVPRTLSIPELYRFLKLLQKYDAMAVIRPWARAWLDGVKHQTGEPWLLWVAWTMGDAVLFREMLFKIAENVRISHSGVSYGEPGRHWTPGGDRGPTRERRVPIDALDGLSAAEVLHLIRDHRRSLVSLELDMYRRMVKRLRHRPGETIMRLHKYDLDLMAPGPDVASRYERAHQNLGRVLPEKRAAICAITHCKKCPFPMSSFMKKAEERKQVEAAETWLLSDPQMNMINVRAEQTGMQIMTDFRNGRRVV